MQAFHRNDPAFQLRGDLPKVGIRPAIDGRRKGIREGLEAQTMGMAKAVDRKSTRLNSSHRL